MVTLGYVHLLHTPCMQKVALYLHPVMGITHVFSCINNCWKLWKLFEHVALILVFKHLTSDPANVNAMKQMGDHYYPPTKSEGYSFGVIRPSVCPSFPSVRPHFLSVRNHISVPIGQILSILGTNDKCHRFSISYKFGQNRPHTT